MRLYLLLLVLGLGLFTTSCQSPRAVALFPAVREHGRAETAPPVTTAPIRSEPVLTAALLDSTAARPSLFDEQLARPSKSIDLPEPELLPADTTLKRKETIILSSKADPTTTAVNVVGGVMTTAGVAVMIASANAKTGGEWGGLGDFIGGLMGFILALAGVALLFFQGKNGRLRRLREARQAARRAIVLPALEPNTPPTDAPLADTVVVTEPRSSERKTGLKLVIVAVALLALSFLPFALIIFTLPTALVLVVLGLAFMLSGE